MISSDNRRIKQILYNLIGIALKMSEADDGILIKCQNLASANKMKK